METSRRRRQHALWRDVLVMAASSMAFVVPVLVIAVASPSGWSGGVAYLFAGLGLIALSLVSLEVVIRAVMRLAHGGTQKGVFVIALCLSAVCALALWLAETYAQTSWGALAQIVTAAIGAAAAHFVCEAVGNVRALRRRYVGH